MVTLKRAGFLFLFALLALPFPLHAAQSPFDIDVKELDKGTAQPPPKAEKKKPKKAKKAAPAEAAKSSGTVQHKGAGSEGEYVHYTVRPGDHIFKILVARFGMSNEAAEKLIPEIIRINNISNIKNLTVGRTLLIPGSRQERAAQSAHGKGRHRKAESESEAAAALPGAPGHEAQQARPPRVVSAPAVAAPSATAAVPPAPATRASEAKAPELPAPPAAAAGSALTRPTPPGLVAPSPITLEDVAPAPVQETPRAAVPSAPAAAPVLATPVVAAPPTAAAAAKEAQVTQAAAAVPALPVIPQATTWICSVPGREPAQVVDAVLNTLALHWSRNRIIQSDAGAPNAFSIRVDRYFELNGVRYIVSIGESDPYTYTLIRLLEGAGYRTLMIGAGDDFKTVAEKLLRLVGLDPDYGAHVIKGGKQITGFLVQSDDAGGRQVLVTGEAADPTAKWTLPAGCGGR